MLIGGRELLCMNWKMKLIALPLMAVLLPSCGWRESQNALNESAMYDPPTVTLIEGFKYPFVEGTLMGRGQKFHSDYSYRRAVIIGGGK